MQVSRDGQTALLQSRCPIEPSVADNKVEDVGDELAPAVASAIPGARADLTGDYAGNLDFTNRLSQSRRW